MADRWPLPIPCPSGCPLPSGAVGAPRWAGGGAALPPSDSGGEGSLPALGWAAASPTALEAAGKARDFPGSRRICRRACRADRATAGQSGLGVGVWDRSRVTPIGGRTCGAGADGQRNDKDQGPEGIKKSRRLRRHPQQPIDQILGHPARPSTQHSESQPSQDPTARAKPTALAAMLPRSDRAKGSRAQGPRRDPGGRQQTRNPTRSSKLAGRSLYRKAERQSRGALNQEPPRSSRRSL